MSLNAPTLPPCGKCPKYNLYPQGFGIRPENVVAATLFNKALKQERVGIDGILTSVMSVPDAIRMIEAHAHLFRNGLEAHECLEKMIALSHAVFKVWSERESKERKRLQREAESKHGR